MVTLNMTPWLTTVWAQLCAHAPPHGLLLCGPEGIGKGVLARYWAQTLLCEDSPAPCQHCPACEWFQAGIHPDFRELVPPVHQVDATPQDTGEWITIDQVRELGDFMMVSAHRQGWKIILIDPADTLNGAAANALLKSLEEPPPRTLFILVTAHMARIPSTLRSRCRIQQVPLPSLGQAGDWLRQQGVDDPEGFLRRAGGAPQRALSQWQKDAEGRRSFLSFFLDSEMPWLQRAEKLANLDQPAWIDWFQYAVMDLILCKLNGRVYYHEDQLVGFQRVASTLSLPDLLTWEQCLRNARRWMAHPLNERLLYESLFYPLQPSVS